MSRVIKIDGFMIVEISSIISLLAKIDPSKLVLPLSLMAVYFQDYFEKF